MEEGAVLQRRGPSLAALRRWSGLGLVAGGLLLAVATALHPSQETPTTILQAEGRLVAAHVLFTLSSLLVLLGLPGLYGTESARMGRLGLAGFLVAFTGTTLVAVSGNFGFIAPVLAAESPASIDAINVYLPEVALNAVAFGGFVVGFVLFGLAMVKRATLPRSSGDAGRRGRPGPGVRIRSGPDRLTGVVDRCRPWERGPRRRPCLAWVSTVAETGALTPRSPAPAAADRHHATRSSGRAASP
jgi:hypothetical protein